MPPVLGLRDITKAFPGVLANDAIDLARIVNPERARRALHAEVIRLRAQQRRIGAERAQIAADLPSRLWIEGFGESQLAHRFCVLSRSRDVAISTFNE